MFVKKIIYQKKSFKQNFAKRIFAKKKFAKKFSTKFIFAGQKNSESFFVEFLFGRNLFAEVIKARFNTRSTQRQGKGKERSRQV